MVLEGLYWREALWLWLALVPLLLPLAARARTTGRWRRLADGHLVPWLRAPTPPRQRLPRVAFAVGWVLLAVALAGPRTPRWIPPEARPPAAAVMVVMDLSASMTATDVAPHRRGLSERLLQAWLAAAPAEYRVGLVVYAGHAHLLLPATADRRLTTHFAAEVEAIRLPTLGNQLAGALELAAARLARAEGQRAVLLLSDGDLEPAARLAAEALAREHYGAGGAALHVVGVGGAEQVAVPGLPARGGEPPLSRREGAWLEALATLGGGRYHPAETLEAAALADLVPAPPRRLGPAAADRVQWSEWFGLPLVAGLVLILMAAGGRRPGAAALVLALAWGAPERAWAGDPETALAAGHWVKARTGFAEQQGYRARFGEGVACYRLEDYDCAARAFAAAAWQAADNAARGPAVFNLGNSHFRRGDYAQAAVLFADAERLGVAPQLTRRNHQFAVALEAAVRRHRADAERALRRAAGGDPGGVPEALADRLAEGITVNGAEGAPEALAALGPERLAELVARGLERFREGGAGGRAGARSGWVRTTDGPEPRSTGALLQRLVEMETGFAAPPAAPRAVEGRRPW